MWTHLEGGSLKDLLRSYGKLMGYFEEFDHLMPGHNQPWLDKALLPETLAGAEKILSGQAESQEGTGAVSRSHAPNLPLWKANGTSTLRRLSIHGTGG